MFPSMYLRWRVSNHTTGHFCKWDDSAVKNSAEILQEYAQSEAFREDNEPAFTEDGYFKRL